MVMCIVFECILYSTLADVTRATDKTKPMLIVEPMNGIGNRIRAFAAAKALAEVSKRDLKIVWTPDVHCNASWTDLFAGHADDLVDGVSHLREGVTTYDLMRNKTAIVRTRDMNHIYVRSAFVMLADVEFTHRIRDIVSFMEPSTVVQQRMVSRQRDIAVHVRMQTSLARDVPGISEDAYESMGGDTLMKMRKSCDWRHFVPVLQYFIAQRPNAAVTVGADVPNAARALLSASGVTNYEILENPRLCYGVQSRHTTCVQHALAHLLSLAQASTLILSEWSSFSEMIELRASRNAMVVHGCEYNEFEYGERNHRGMSVVVACRNRGTFAEVARAVRAVFPRAEIIVVDWNSIPAYAPAGDVVRIVHQSKWNLAQAYNVAFRRATHERVLKIDCDTLLTCRPTLDFRPGVFATGSWQSGNVHLNGLLTARRADFLAVNGYDERIVRYGWEDTDLHNRLVQQRGLQRIDLNLSCFRHLDHEHAQNGEQGAMDDFHAEVSTQANRLCTLGRAWDGSANRSVYRHVAHVGGDAHEAMNGRARVQLLQVSHSDSIERSPTCDYKTATAAVLFKLWQGCPQKNCVTRFWDTSKQRWNTVREFMMRLVPNRMDAGLRCLRAWRSDRSPVKIPVCKYARDG